jgi:hypothetical protein
LNANWYEAHRAGVRVHRRAHLGLIALAADCYAAINFNR